MYCVVAAQIVRSVPHHIQKRIHTGALAHVHAHARTRRAHRTRFATPHSQSSDPRAHACRRQPPSCVSSRRNPSLSFTCGVPAPVLIERNPGGDTPLSHVGEPTVCVVCLKNRTVLECEVGSQPGVYSQHPRAWIQCLLGRVRLRFLNPSLGVVKRGGAERTLNGLWFRVSRRASTTRRV